MISEGPVRVPVWNQGSGTLYGMALGTKFCTGTLAGIAGLSGDQCTNVNKGATPEMLVACNKTDKIPQI